MRYLVGVLGLAAAVAAQPLLVHSDPQASDLEGRVTNLERTCGALSRQVQQQGATLAVMYERVRQLENALAQEREQAARALEAERQAWKQVVRLHLEASMDSLDRQDRVLDDVLRVLDREQDQVPWGSPSYYTLRDKMSALSDLKAVLRTERGKLYDQTWEVR